METPSLNAFVLVGPTASGKSAVAQLLAEQIGTPIISADSMSLYRGMNVGTAKPSPAERGSVNYFGLDLAEPTESCSVGDWLAAIRLALHDSFRDQTPIVVGGTGLYVNCLLQGLDDLPIADEALRARTDQMTLAELQAEAHQAAPQAYETLADKKNRRRLIRLLEHGGQISNHWKKELPTVVGLYVERNVLHQRIAERVEQMYAGGLLEEARSLANLNLSLTARRAIGYAEAFAVLRGDMTVAEAKEKTLVRTRQLAKRQMTWFRHQLNVEWINTSNFPSLEKLGEEVFRLWMHRGPIRLLSI